MKVGWIVIFTVILASCKVSKEQVSNIGKGNSDIVKGKVEIPRVSIRDGDTTIVTRAIEYSYLNCKEVYCDSVNEKVIDFVRRNTEFEYDENAVLLDRTFFQDQLNYFDSLARIEEEISEDMPPWELVMSTEILLRDSYVDLALNVWSFTGGAHGNGYYANFLIDRTTARTLVLSDVINDVAKFTELAEGYFRKQNSIQPEEDLSELGFWFQDNKFSLNDNFHFTGDSMAFFYNSYEIAPYSAGQIEFSIPLKDIQGYLKIQP